MRFTLGRLSISIEWRRQPKMTLHEFVKSLGPQAKPPWLVDQEAAREADKQCRESKRGLETEARAIERKLNGSPIDFRGVPVKLER